MKSSIFPHFENNDLISSANIGDLKHIHGKECHSTVKFARLVQKVLHPSSLERQNVSLAVRLFDEKNIAALTIIQKDNVGTTEFLKIILSWWKIIPLYCGLHCHIQTIQAVTVATINRNHYLLEKPQSMHSYSAYKFKGRYLSIFLHKDSRFNFDLKPKI
nr:unnamed protein product [Callosobruchus analis]